ncbi:MAG: excinuclease ABC subunit UvrB [Patescibacteria group bacterium]|nr:excinuclease ABC subunit UvrB [Patescibacteria group bacterium]
MLHLSSKFNPAGDQPKAIKELTLGFKKGDRFQTLLGVTGSGKTFTMANVIQNIGKPTLIISHNKTLAAQLYEEFKMFFPHDHVHYFVSYYDYYQPEAYLPNSDTYIEKTAQINEEIEQLRHAAVQSVLQYPNTIIVASVSCIYNLGSPQTFRGVSLLLEKKQETTSRDLLKELLALQYERNELEFKPGRFRKRDAYIDVWPSGSEDFLRIEISGGVIASLTQHNPYTADKKILTSFHLFPAKFWISEEKMRTIAVANIQTDLAKQIATLQKNNMPLEAERLKRRTNYDVALIKELGWCKGIENYTRYFEGRDADTPPFTLMDYFPKEYLLMIDESHMSLPQIRGMYEGDRSRKKTLIEHGFRLPSALDNRPLQFHEFEKKFLQCLFSSATPSDFERKKSAHIAEQIVRPTYLVDPPVEVRKTEGQIPNLIKEIQGRVARKERVLVTVLTKRSSETLAKYLKDKKIKAVFLHSEIDTLERPKILMDLRKGIYDVLVGINLLREGLDLPEVSLVAILDADKEGFLRDTTSFIQIAGRAARNLNSKVLMYADTYTLSMKKAISEMTRRRAIQEEYNKKHKVIPAQIVKDISYTLRDELEDIEKEEPKTEAARDYVKELQRRLDLAQRNLQFGKAAALKKRIEEIKKRK